MGRLSLAVQAPDGQARCRVRAVGHARVQDTVEPVLGREDGLEPHALGPGEEIDVAPALGVHPGLVRHEPDDPALELRPILDLEDVEAGAGLDARQPVVCRAAGGLCLALAGRGNVIGREELGAHDGAHTPAQLDDRALARRMHAVRQDDDVCAGRRIHPDGRAGESRVPDRPYRKERAQGARVIRGHVPAEPARGFARPVRREHGVDRGAGEIAAPALHAVAEQHPAEAPEVVRRREEPRVPGDAVELAGARIVDHAAQHLALEDLGRRDAGAPGGRRVEGRLPHAERLVEALARERGRAARRSPGARAPRAR